MAVRVRKAEPGDLPALVVLWNQLMDFHANLDPAYERLDDAAQRWSEYILPKLDDDDWRMLVAESESGIVGHVVAVIQQYPPVYEQTRHGVVETVVVQGDLRGRGIGRQLVDAAERWLRGRNVPEITVRIDERNPASKALFRNAGFEPWVVVRRKVLRDPE